MKPLTRQLATLASCAAFAALAMLANPAFALWPESGLRIAGPATLQALHHDGASGAIVVWTTSGSRAFLHVSRIGPDGAPAAGWTADGITLPPQRGRAEYFTSAPDGAGGVYLMTSADSVLYPVVFGTRTWYRAWHFGADGTLASGWPAEGELLDSTYVDVDTECGRSLSPWPSQPDSAGGAFLLTRDRTYCPSGSLRSISGWHLHPDRSRETAGLATFDDLWSGTSSMPDGRGGAIGVTVLGGHVNVQRWHHSGVQQTRVLVSGGGPGDPTHGGATPLGPDGAMLAWYRHTVVLTPDTAQWRLVRLDRDAQYDATWPVGGMLTQVVPVMGDGTGGAFFGVSEAGTPRLQRVAASAWPPVPLWSSPGLPLLRSGLRVLDGGGGLFQSWLEAERQPLRAEHVGGDGAIAAHWPAGGVLLSGAAKSPWYSCAAGAGHAFVAWTDAGADSNSVYLQWLGDDAPVPAQASLASTWARPDRVTIEWHAPGAGPFRVERRRDGEAWTARGEAADAGGDVRRFDDPDVRPGDALAYRLTRDGFALAGSEVRVVVPAGVRFALRGFTGSPRAEAIEFTLPDAARARLELFDAAGRRVSSREVGGLGAGTHRVTLPELAEQAPGLWFARLTRAGVSLHAKTARLR